jgi:hypothetical protein
MIDPEDDKFTLKPRYIYRYFIYALNSDGTLGSYLGDAYAHDEVDAKEYALRVFKDHFRHGVKIVDATMN